MNNLDNRNLNDSDKYYAKEESDNKFQFKNNELLNTIVNSLNELNSVVTKLNFGITPVLAQSFPISQEKQNDNNVKNDKNGKNGKVQIAAHEILADSDEFYTKTESDNKFQNKTDNSLNTNNKTVVGAINEVQSRTATGWISGEYKWMSPTIKDMPTGWKKVSMTKGFTLIVGDTVDTSKGSVISHSHKLNNLDDVPLYKIRYYLEGTFTSQAYKYCVPIWNSKNDIEYIWNTDSAGDTNNLAAGMYAVLWQYDPKNIFSQTDTIEMI